MSRSRPSARPGVQVKAAHLPGLAVPEVTLRPLRPGETGPVEAVFGAMSPQSRLLRFLAPTPRLTPSVLAYLAAVDHDVHGCWVAWVRGAPVALGRYVRLPGDPSSAEIALEVIDAMQGRGLGGLLLEIISAAAASVGVEWLVWTMDAGNVRARQLGLRAGATSQVATAGVAEGRGAVRDVRHRVDAHLISRLAAEARLSAAAPGPAVA
jgi:GNAT superfamily N-acetyltransferase